MRRSPRRTRLLLIAAFVAACSGTGAPTPVPTATPDRPPATASIGPSTATGIATSADGRITLRLPDGWRALSPTDPAFDEWFDAELAASVRNGLVSIVAIDEAGSEPDRPTFALLAPVEDAAYAAAAARSFVDRSVASGSPAVLVSEVELPAGPARRIRIDGTIAGAEGASIPSRQVIHLVRAGGTLALLAVQAVDRSPEVAEAAADFIAASLVLPDVPGDVPDVPAHGCGAVVPFADAVDADLALESLGAAHAEPGAAVEYAHCPPTSGTHYAAALLARLHGPTEPTVPQEWVHNLEHGQVLLLYACAPSCGDVPDNLDAIVRGAPSSPLCGIEEVLVATRYDDIPAPFALAAWGRLRYLRAPDPDMVAAFIRGHADRGPEARCAAAEPPSAAP